MGEHEMIHFMALRLHPGQDLKVALDDFVQKAAIEAACVLTCVGSLRSAVIRFADQEEGSVLADDDGRFEIVSLTGVLSHYGSHYHISLSDSLGRTVGGHLLEGCRVYTTAEIVLAVLPGVRFLRQMDEDTGYPELVIEEMDLK